VATGANEPDRVRNALVQLGGLGITAILLRAARIWPARSWTPARSTRSAVRRAGPARRVLRRDPLEGEGAERIAQAVRALSLECGRGGRRRADHRPHAGVVAVFTGLVADLGTVEAVEATADGVRLAVRTAARARDLRRRQRRRSTASA
jgi:hypothetical protein